MVHFLVFDNKYIWAEGMNSFLQCRRHLSNGQLKPLDCTPTHKGKRKRRSYLLCSNNTQVLYMQ